MDNHDKVIGDMVEGVKDMLDVKKNIARAKRVSSNNKKILDISKSLGEVSKEVYLYDQRSATKLIRLACDILKTLDETSEVLKEFQEKAERGLSKIEGKRNGTL
jgi:chromosome segregation ATPase